MSEENAEAPAPKAPAKKKAAPKKKEPKLGEPVGTVVDGAPSSIHRAVILPD